MSVEATKAVQRPSSDTYIFDRSEADHERLRRIADRLAAGAREACLRAGLRPGDRAIDVGCGPLGALPVLAELVGSAGAVVGLDVHAETLEQARRGCEERGLANVSLVQGDINTLEPSALVPRRTFDLAFCRYVLSHQPDPAATLRRIAALLRSGGRIVAQDPLHDPNYPRCNPPVPAACRAFELAHAAIAAKGGSPGMGQRYPEVCAVAGLRLLSQRGAFEVFDDPCDLLANSRRFLASIRRSVLEHGLATADELDGLDRELAEAETRPPWFATSMLFVVMTAEAP